jgi:uncharacterized protein (DUF2236 family)
MDLAKRSPDTALRFDVPHRVNAERVVLLGWSRAILLQLAHPLVAAGVHEHSSFRATPWAAAARLHSTVRAMLALTFGTDAEREHALYGIRQIHRRVHGHLAETVGIFPAGTPYSAEDPALVLWVHLTLLESVPLVYELFVGPLTESERDEYCEGAAWVALELGARPLEVPRTWRETQAALTRTYGSGAIAVGPQARELAAAVLAPRIGRFIPLAAWLNRLITVGFLPAAIREQYQLSWGARNQQSLERAIPRVRAVRRRLPTRLAIWPEARG